MVLIVAVASLVVGFVGGLLSGRSWKSFGGYAARAGAAGW